MNVTLYKNTSEKAKVGKTLTSASVHTGTLREGCEVVNPTIIVEGVNLSDFNYMYIPEFHRYYFITGITSVKKGLWQIDGHCDVLETYQAQIKAQKAVVERQENDYNLYLNDPEWKVYTNKQVLTREFPSGFLASGNYFLTVVGGYDDVTEGSGV